MKEEVKNLDQMNQKELWAYLRTTVGDILKLLFFAGILMLFFIILTKILFNLFK